MKTENSFLVIGCALMLYGLAFNGPNWLFILSSSAFFVSLIAQYRGKA